MCGIAGIVLRSGNVSNHPEAGLRPEVLESLRHRGPDSRGLYYDGRVSLGHVRLSVLDLTTAGNQPMATDDGHFVICYNGEVYNFLDLAQSLGLGRLRSHSDTEVILRAFAKEGVAAVTLSGARPAWHQAALLSHRRRRIGVRFRDQGTGCHEFRGDEL